VGDKLKIEIKGSRWMLVGQDGDDYMKAKGSPDAIYGGVEVSLWKGLSWE
jgi:hypothetical protein